MDYYRWRDGSLLLSCHVQPKASKDEFAGVHCDRLKIRIKAAPVDGKANAAFQQLLAKQFKVAKTAVSIESGENSRQKTALIDGPKEIPKTLDIQPS